MAYDKVLWAIFCLDPVPRGVISFLLRTAYLFEELREPVVKYVARTCGAEISKKSVQQEYADHPERAELCGEIISELFSREK